MLAQHVELRVEITAARRVLERFVAGGSRASLRAALARVVDRLRLHNLREEELMRDVFPTLDAWGIVRAEVMVEAHVVEHRQLYEALRAADQAADILAVATTVSDVLDQLLEHMAREERVFLGEDVLSDDVIVPDAFGG